MNAWQLIDQGKRSSIDGEVPVKEDLGLLRRLVASIFAAVAYRSEDSRDVSH